MLLEFSVENYRSIRDEQTFSMEPAYKKSRTVDTGIASSPRALLTSAIYGANGSGKSNFYKALQFVGSLLNFGLTLSSTEELAYEPFLLCESCKTRPSKFSLTFAYSDATWLYELSIVEGYVSREVLKRRSNQKGARLNVLYERESDRVVKLHQSLGSHRRLLSDQTNTNQLFLAKLDQSGDKVTRPAFVWMSQKLRVIDDVTRFPDAVTARECTTPEGKKLVSALLQAFDVPHDSINVAEEEIQLPEEFLDKTKDGRSDITARKSFTDYEVTISRLTDVGAVVSWPIYEESSGTQSLFSMAGPLLLTLRHGFTLFIDELNQTFHPELLRELVGLFQDREVNPYGGQLVFTSHDTSVMNGLKRDEIWLVEKGENGATELNSLADFDEPNDGRNRRAGVFGKRYLDGRYGALPYVNIVPFIREFRKIEQNQESVR